MIKKIVSISHLGVFENFMWDTCVVSSNGNVSPFLDCNILYGRNYSGKTSLSRIFRAFEVGNVSDKYPDAAFKIKFSDDSVLDQTNLSGHDKCFRVFNEDFIRSNFKFVTNPEDNTAESFSIAVIGDRNNEIEEEISTIQVSLGTNEEGHESGLYLSQKSAQELVNRLQPELTELERELEKSKNWIANNNPEGIRYKSELYGNQNYNVRELEKDIHIVSSPDYSNISDINRNEYYQALKEVIKAPLAEYSPIVFQFELLCEKAKALTSKRVGQAGKIEALARDAAMQKWVEMGMQLHVQNQACGFCGGKISDERWKDLQGHFDDEILFLKQEINNCIEEINRSISILKSFKKPNLSNLYIRFQENFEKGLNEVEQLLEKFISALTHLIDCLNRKQENPFEDVAIQKTQLHSKELVESLERLNEIIRISNAYSSNLADEHKKIKERLRLDRVSRFVIDTSYFNKLDSIKNLGLELRAANEAVRSANEAIFEKLKLIEQKRASQNDERVGADRVNFYLREYFGNNHLHLEVVEENAGSGHKFEVRRSEQKAHHLSEGECRLITFCYFVAKLHDTASLGRKPLIWIDDPISSLDSNHVFSIFSFISVEVLDQDVAGQIFISTHNLEFLKYLKRLSWKKRNIDGNIMRNGRGDAVDRSKEYFIVERLGNISQIRLMPKYLKEYITEFNFLFHQLYQCAEIERVDDSNYHLYYNFGNNARKFLELFMFFKFPDSSEFDLKLRRFFGDEDLPVILSNRINNEYSHLSGCLERGELPIEVPEMRRVASLIISKLREDQGQFQALCASVGINSEALV
ncbi:hypothetical protein EPD60_12335 [Flaviaesturariibacter flavus]|uniref:Protein CR006 P-loop domain-containing protein n=1 Tax=Flaviaesturariibacter flavus TaxID=2502780 RepID=A0A4R1B9J6_9BACT|nr:AAA family ATPase [Flaviaesturariibacter flavus]TCJ13579.1 hypothetical protein EPD60_12335 [Flaviaesturariibacter flavus]